MALLSAAAATLSAPAAHAQGCITVLPIRIALAPYAGGSVGQMPVTVSSRGPAIRRLKIGIYTFGGMELGSASVPGVTTQRSRRVLLRLRFGRMQAGRFTLYATGEPNPSPSCGPKFFTRIQRFVPCPRHLPVSFPLAGRPHGLAVSYPDRVPVLLRARGPILRDLHVTLQVPFGAVYGEGDLPILFGEAPIDARLHAPVPPGHYVAVVRGWIANAPACGVRAAAIPVSLS